MIYILIVIFLALQVADAYTTIYGVRNGLSETNPIMRKLFATLGLYIGLFVMKVPITAVVVYVVLTEQVGVMFMCLLVVPFAGLLVNNLYWLNKARI